MAEKKPKEIKELTLEEKFDALQKTVEVLQADKKQSDEKIAMLTDVADRGRVENFESKNKKDVGSIVNISTLDGIVVVAWRMVMDDVYKDAQGTWHEKQVVEVTTEDEKKHPMEYVDFIRKIKKVPVRVELRGKKLICEEPETYAEEFRVSYEGKTYNLDSAFIN